jgi:hypothetical protein
LRHGSQLLLRADKWQTLPTDLESAKQFHCSVSNENRADWEPAR